MKGRIHSLESFGAVDGPGVRYVVFLQGCPMRCAYCHNPDTWALGGGTMMEPAEILAEYMKKSGFYRGGGLTVTGGEPMLQIPFLIDLFTQARNMNIHTCLDTSGIVFNPNNEEFMSQLEVLLTQVDLVLLDIKHIDPIKHKKLVKQPNEQILAFAQYLSDHSIPMWIRHVVVPGLTDSEVDLYNLGYFVGGLKTVKALDALPYHTMGVSKYESMGMEYPLEGVPSMDKSVLVEKKEFILKGIRDRRNGLSQDAGRYINTMVGEANEAK